MVALVEPDEEEKYLLAILDSADGIDLAEFAFHDPRNDDGCYRLYDYQWPWFSSQDMYQVDQGGRNLGKTERVKLRSAAHPFYHAGKGRLLTAPELNHLRPLTDEIEKILLGTRIVKEMMPSGKGAGIARQPHWQVRFKNGSTIISRLPNKDGKGVKGQHVVELEIDEAQDYPAAGWREVVETLNAGDPDAKWCCHGVSRGVRDSFFDKTQPKSGWKVHRPMAMNRPSWTAEERNNKIVEYGGSRQAVDYKRNIYGEHGDASNSVFVLSKLMAVVDLDEGSTYNSDVYTCIKMELERFPNGAGTSDDERAALIAGWIDVPGTHFHGYNQRVANTQVGAPNGYSAYWGGMDVGVTNHPSEILIFGQRVGSEFLELLTRVHMQRINTDDQMLVVTRLFALYGDKLRFGIDKTGVGFPLWDQLTRRPFGGRIYGFGFSEKRVAGFEERDLAPGETQKDLARYRNVVEAATDWLRNDHVDTRRFRLPYDREVLIEFQGQSYTTVRDNGDPYGVRRQYSGGSFHTLDAAKVAVAAKYIPPLEAMLDAQPRQAPVLDVFLGA
jgi:hypothetical protein